MRREDRFDGEEDGGGEGGWEQGLGCCIWSRTLSIMESQMLWQVREAVSLPPAPPTGPPRL